MINAPKKKPFNVPASLKGLIEQTRPLADGTLRRLERKLDVVHAVREVCADKSLPRAERFATALITAAPLIRQRVIAAAVFRMGAYVQSGAPPERVFRELCVGAAGALHRSAVDDLRGVLSILHAAHLVWPACDVPRPADVAGALEAMGLEPGTDAHTAAQAMLRVPTPAFLARADKLRASGVRGGSFAAFAAEGLGADVAEGFLTEAEAEDAWAEKVWRPGELETVVSYL